MNTPEELNAEQRPAVEAGDGPLVIVAGPGTGKTKTLTARIAYLVQNRGVRPDRILALTFTNKAAQEMQERVEARLGFVSEESANSQKPIIATFHALAHLLLDLPPKYKLIDDIERLVLLQLLKEHKAAKGLSLRDMSLTISRAKNRPGGALDADTRALVKAYNIELHTRDLHDYDDLLVWLYEALQRPEFRQKAQKFDHILVDEFQDTNELQYEIIRQLNRTNNLFVIGDPLQSIYGFRGASGRIFDRFEADFPHATHIRLLTNYRSAPEIVRLSGAIFPDTPALHAYRREPGIAQSIEVLNEYGEADWIVGEVERQLGGSDLLRASLRHGGADRQRTFKDFAVMSRTHAALQTVQAALEKSGIPYQVVGEGSPYLQPQAAAVIQSFAYLVGFSDAPGLPGVKPQQVARLLDPLKAVMHDMPLSTLAVQITDLLNLTGEKDTAKMRQFTNALLRYDTTPPAVYVRHVQELAEQEYYDPAAGAVTLLTIHAAKGLEFPVVILAGVEEGSLPLARKGVVTDAEEEKRLFYVAVTRARDELYALHAKNRKNKPCEPSSFLTALPKGVLQSVSDPAMDGQLKRIRRRAQKRAQGSLF